MPKRKFQDEDNAPTPSASNSQECLRQIDDENGRLFDYMQPGTSRTAKKESTHHDSVSLDQDHEDRPDRKTSMIPEALVRSSDNVDGNKLSTRAVTEEYAVESGILIKTLAIMPVSKTALLYNMNHPKRGICMVFNQEIFDDFSERKGSEQDVKSIRTTFTNLNFNVVVHENLKYSEVMAEIGTLSDPKKTEHGDSDCVCIFVLTHGLNNNFILAKDASYSSDKIWKPFTADKCPKLAGKPKLFFIQACRGDKLDDCVTLVEGSGNADDQRDSPNASYTIPTHSDFLIGHSCQDGFSAIRNREKGTWYVQCLCDVLDEFAASTDLMKMLTMTAQKVANDRTSYVEETYPEKKITALKQVPSVFSTLTRDVYFVQQSKDITEGMKVL